MPANPRKLTDEQEADLISRHELGETQVELGKAFGIATSTVHKILKRAGKGRPPAKPATSIVEFCKRARSILWRQDDGKERKTYDKWQEAVKNFEKGGLNHRQAAVQASKDFPCLKQLFREYNVGENDPHPDSHPDIPMWGERTPADQALKIEGKKQTHRENLNWAITAAGRYLRTGEPPESCPNDAAYYLYRQACDEPKDFLGKFNQIEAKGDGDLEEQRLAKRSGQRSIEEIEEMLELLGD